ncbi:enoyl-CoA hydratase 2, peroxisomal-like isoform X2 [Phragmites australis]|uniref:enoyl-CoA hydratase 2, peroxisomal-like isoform X2 n=1 Tax=Phragmites australis TaxID=29695 RepID=UPI002D76D5D6|nr:enoyl-CoA hydratase 2, peroxisomal-like isoform X2 [Phragmites australis]
MATSSTPAAAVSPEVVLVHKFPEVSFAYDEREVALYALGVGACGADAVDEKELHFVYHRDGQPHIKVLPTFVSLFPNKNSNGLGFVDVPGLNFDASLLLHGQQYIEMYKPIPSYANVVNKIKVAGLHDKGKATVLELETTTSLKDSGEILCMNRSTIYLRGAGGFSDSSRPYSYANYPANQVPRISIPNSAPSAVYEDQTKQSQALLYRLSGDYNPLHSDPEIAQIAGFTRPILHGLCTLGFATRAVIKSFCNGEPTTVKSIFGRFLLHVYPGETLSTEMWLDGQKVHYQTKVKERNRAVLAGFVLLKHIPSSLTKQE